VIVTEMIKKRGKSILVKGRGDPQVCETSRPPHFLDNGFTVGGEVRSTHRPLFPPRKISGTRFC
jgi:hypothetical protein